MSQSRYIHFIIFLLDSKLQYRNTFASFLANFRSVVRVLLCCSPGTHLGLCGYLLTHFGLDIFIVKKKRFFLVIEFLP